MRFLFYTHSLVSDWNHGNAHFLRGVMRELQARGHEACALEPVDSWSRRNLRDDQGAAAEARFAQDFPALVTQSYDAAFDHEAAVAQADVVIVHEWTDPALVERIGRARREGRFTLLFHDTHHRAVSSQAEIAGLSLDAYDGILAFGETLRQRYLKLGWGEQVFTWHEAADVALFRPHPEIVRAHDLIWVGNWGDGERSEELQRFLIGPVRTLGLDATVRGVRYPDHALRALSEAGLRYRGWIANADVPAAFAAHRLTVHVPRRPYIEALPGIPTIRMFEALACGIPLVSAPWPDEEGLFRAGQDFLFVANEADMTAALHHLLADPARAEAQASAGLETILARHTCGHRADELIAILGQLGRTDIREAS